MQMDSHCTIFPVSRPDADDLERFMLKRDAPYEHRKTKHGDIEILAKGRSAVTLLVWLDDLVRSASTGERSASPKMPTCPVVSS
jgi:hypothetical protein